jgi:predicted metal-dependent hydrolase
LDPRYLAFFDCFNRQLFFEAHEVLEALWLETRHSADGDFFRGLIQLAAAFVHWQDQKPGPARMLLGKARAYLANYPKVHHRLDIATVLRLVDKWLRWVEPIALGRAPSGSMSPPQLQLIGSDSSHG